MSLRKLAGIVLPVLQEASVCEACGGEFACGAKLSGCWCAEVELSEAVRAELRLRYRGCLCRACLERFAAGAARGNIEGGGGV
jgi:hypothetical protein